MWRNRRIVRFGHARNHPQFGDAPGIANVRLQDHRRVLFQNLAEPPLRKNALTGGERNVRLLGEFRHDVHIQRLYHFFIEPGMIRLQRLDQQLRRRRLDRAMEIDADVHTRALLLAQRLEPLGHFVHKFLPFHIFERRARGTRRHLHGVHASLGVDRAIDAHPVARRTAEQLVYRHSIDLALDVPQRLIDAAEDRRLDRTSAIKRAPVDRLPVEHHAIGVLADEVAAHFHGARGAGFGVVFEHLAPAGYASVGRDLHKHPGVL